MIDIRTETILTLTNATKNLPRRRAGKRPHVGTLYRWAQHGMRGVRLEIIQIGGTLCTSLEALQRFFDELTVRDRGDQSEPRRTTSREEQIRKAEKELEQAGI